jgi:hypothetical protein
MSDVTVLVYNALQDVVGPDVGGRVHYPSLPPDAIYPCVVYSQIYGGDGQQLSGQPGLYQLRYQVDLFSTSITELAALRLGVLSGFHRYRADIILDTRIDLDIPYFMEELGVHRHIIGLTISNERES